jgi:hypothetical protein
MEDKKIAVIKIKLKDIATPVWRRVEVPLYITIHRLHDIIQETMGWANSHLYYFKIAGINYDINNEDSLDLPGDVDSREAKLADVWDKAKQCVYAYDFGDDWKHEVHFERLIPAEDGVKYPRCAEGAGKCPPEDIGGVTGYERLLKIIKNPDSPEKKEFKEWLGWSEEDFKDFNPEDFDIDEANRKIDALLI